MAGTDPRFDSSQFRSAIHFVMQMAAPSDQPVTWQWKKEVVYSSHDADGRPFVWGDTPISVTDHPDVVVDCIVEFTAASTQQERDTVVGHFDPGTIIITVLDDDIATIEGASHVVAGGNTYEIMYRSPSDQLFDVEIHYIYAKAIDQS